MKVDDDIEPFAAKAPAKSYVVEDPPEASRALGDDDLVDVRIVSNDGLGGLLNEVGNAGVREMTPEGRDGRCRKHDIANQAQPDEQDLHP